MSLARPSKLDDSVTAKHSYTLKPRGQVLIIYPPGARIAGRYEVTTRPLMGGMGVVYLCFDHREDRPVALKTFKPEYLPDRAARDRFLREGTTWVDLGRHPHIVQAYAVERIGDGREVYLVLEWVVKEEGCADASLRSWLMPSKALNIEIALLFGLQIVRGMTYATEVIPGFVHRDLKPENVLVGVDRLSRMEINRVRVTDFGMATASYDLWQTQFTHRVMGTPVYMAPEQWKGKRVSVETDVYAFGGILYEMLAGRRAVEGKSLKELEIAHRRGEVRPLPVELPGVVRDMVLQCLALEPDRRYGSWQELEEALRKVYEDITEQTAPEPEPLKALGWAERVAVGWSYSAMGASYLDIGKTEVAREYFEQALKIGREQRERKLELAGLTHLGLAYARLGDTQQAIESYEQALTISREIGSRRGESNVLGNLGSVYLQLGDSRRAIELFEQQLVIIGEIGDRRGEGNVLGNLGSAYASLGDTRRAVSFYERRLEVAREIGDRRGEGNVLGNLGVAYADLGDTKRAIGYYEQALAIAREIGDRRGERNVLGNLGNAYMDLGDNRQVIRYYEQALAIGREIGDLMGVAINSGNMALWYARQGELDRALPLAQQAAEIFTRIGHARYAQRAQQLVAQLRDGATTGNGPDPGEILRQFAPVIAAVVAATRGDAAARTQVEKLFDTLTRNNWHMVEPIQRIWAGERDEAKLTAGLDANSTLIVRAILKQLERSP